MAHGCSWLRLNKRGWGPSLFMAYLNLNQTNLGKTIINHPPNRYFYRFYKPFPNGWLVLPTLNEIRFEIHLLIIKRSQRGCDLWIKHQFSPQRAVQPSGLVLAAWQSWVGQEITPKQVDSRSTFKYSCAPSFTGNFPRKQPRKILRNTCCRESQNCARERTAKAVAKAYKD